MKKVIFGVLGFFLILALAIFWYVSRFGGDDSKPEVAQETLRDTQSGPVVGFTDDGVNVWLGIPYAKPPLGDLRWRAPREADPWDTPRPAITFGDECPQGMMGASGNEDCLYLNVWSPESAAVAKPVMFFIHGGGNVIGSADAGGLYDGHRFAAKHDVVLVSINYRLGTLGWFSHPDLKVAETEPLAAKDNSGNYGTLDIIAALEWVQKNILNLSDGEIDAMQKQMNKEAGLDPDEGGVDVPDGGDGITRYPSIDGAPLPADDVAKLRGETPPEENGDK